MTLQQSGRPAHGMLTRRVWEIADALLAASGKMPRGREGVDAYMAEDDTRSEGTGFTQYSHWKRAQALAAEGEELRVQENGVIRFPISVLEALGLCVGDRLVATLLEDCAVRVEPVATAVQRARAMVQSFDTGTGSPVDEMIEKQKRKVAP